MNTNTQIEIVKDVLAIFTAYNISKLDTIAIMEVIKYDLLRQHCGCVPYRYHYQNDGSN